MRTFIFLSTLTLILVSCSVASAQEPPPAKVVVEEITREVISENRSYIGRLSYDRMSRVSADVSGLVEKSRLILTGSSLRKTSNRVTGFIGLWLVNAMIAPQPFDVLTMLGFIILIGTVVNNAIIIVHQSLNNVRYHDLIGVAAVTSAVKTRIRPIFMSATTSLLALSPLVLSTGSGSELYRGLGSILLGGLAVSTMFTLFVIPSLLVFVIGRETSRTDR